MRGSAGFAALMLCACIKVSDGPVEVDPPPRPKNVPESAQWCGGIDGGVFIEMTGDVQRGFRGAIYADRTGHLWYAGPFRLTSTSNGPDLGDKKWCGGWDGTQIAIRKGGALIAVNLNP